MTVVLFLLSSISISAQHLDTKTIGGDTITYSYTPLYEPKRSGVERYLSSDLDDRKVRFNIIGGPGYSVNTGWRLALIGNMYYRQRGTQTSVPGTLSLTATASLTGYYSISAIGRNYFDRGQHRIDYRANFASEPTRVWGLDYDTAQQDDAGRYTSREYGAWLRYRYSFTQRFFLSFMGDYAHIAALKADDRAQQLTLGEQTLISSLGIGLGCGYDSRNTSTNASRGIYTFIEFITRPKTISSLGTSLYQLNITFDYYQPLWRGATLALDLYGEFHNSSTPWLLRAKIGGDSRMRGYYLGRYNGDILLSAQLELRQHIWEGLSCAIWGGAGTAFSRDDSFAWRKVLPTYGGGLRWTFNPQTSIRLDMAFGRHGHLFILGLNEAF